MRTYRDVSAKRKPETLRSGGWSSGYAEAKSHHSEHHSASRIRNSC